MQGLGLLKKNFNKLKKIISNSSDRDILFIKIRKQVLQFIKEHNISLKQTILYGPSFSIFEPTQIQDFLITQSLILRGARIIPLGMGTLEEGASVFGGGFWTEFKVEVDDNVLTASNHKKICANDRMLWNSWCGLNQLFLSDYLNHEEKEHLRKIACNFDLNDYKNWNYDEMPVGQWALDVLRNNYMVGDETLIENYKNKLQRLLFNIILCIKALKKALKEVDPDLVISNDSFYYPWSILEILAKRNGIPFYSYWVPVGREGACAYAMNDPAMALNFSKTWESFKLLPMSDAAENLIDNIVNAKKRGEMLVINTADPSANSDCISTDVQINFDKPTVLLTANVVWDLAALNKEIQFKNMFDWIIETVRFFENNPQWQLIIKPHPVEESRHIPITSQRVKDVVMSSFKKIPDNVILLDPKTKYDVYYFFDKIKIGLVFTSTAGLEMVCHGIPVITAGRGPYYDKGFTYDTKTKCEYFDTLTTLLTTNLAQKHSKEYSILAKKFFKLNFFHYYMRTNLFDYAAGKKDGLTLNIRSSEDLMPGKNLALDYICNSILDHKPIVSENRWPHFNTGNL